MKKDFLLEVGSENLPSGYIDPAIEQLKVRVVELLESSRVGFDSIEVYGTPRRLVVYVAALADKQGSSEERIMGPPLNIAVDGDGNFTKAAEGFARSQGVSVSELKKVQTERGMYLAVVRRVPGRKTRTILRESIPGIVASIRFPKTMKWDDSGFRWPRPVRWVLCLFGDDLIRFKLGGVKSGRYTRFSVFDGSDVEVKSAGDYFGLLKRRGVVLSNHERKELVRRMALETAEKCGGRLVEDDGLVRTVANMLEVPVPIIGSYSREFLKLPEEVIVTALKSHQRYFSVRKKRGEGLMPFFVAFADGARKNVEGIRKGYERVLHARLDDAVFYYNEDTAEPLDRMAEKLSGIVWMEGLGDLLKKSVRIEKLALWLNDVLGGKGAASIEKLKKASRLAKADLASEMVKDGKEFTLLQGYIGREYARKSGIDEDIANAIFEHYLPRFAGDRLPEGRVGMVLALADKADTVAGCFALGLEPSGSQDPYALRRHAAGLLRILIEKELAVSMRELFTNSIDLVLSDASEGRIRRDREELFELVMAFMSQRLNLMLRSSGFDYDLVNAVISAPWDSPLGVRNTVNELQERRKKGTLESLVLAIKRISNILPGQYRGGFTKEKGESVINSFASGDEGALGFSSSLFEEDAENELYQAAVRAAGSLTGIYRDYKHIHESVTIFEGLKEAVNRYFDDVLVNCNEEEIRKNRLVFLQRLNHMVSLFVDFSKVAGE